MFTPVNQFLLYKKGCRGSSLHGFVFVMYEISIKELALSEQHIRSLRLGDLNNTHCLGKMAKELSNLDHLALKSKVYKAARDGRADIILDLLSNLDSNDQETIIHEVVNHLTQDGEQITTPLIIAAKNGITEVVKVLLDIFHVNMEETGVVTFKGEKFADNTALCCAVASCQLDIIELFLEHGANITHKACNNVTPLTIACNIGIIDINYF